MKERMGKTTSLAAVSDGNVQARILTIRGVQVMSVPDLADSREVDA